MFNSVPPQRYFWAFAHLSTKKRRYIQTKDTQAFLEKVIEMAKTHTTSFEKGKPLWRAQIGYRERPLIVDDEYIDDEPVPFTKSRMKPKLDEAKEGRANPKGIPYLYAATKEKTALYEVRPWNGVLISLGKFSVTQELTLVDCRMVSSNKVLYQKPLTPMQVDETIWSDIGSAFTVPITSSDKLAEYVPTQIIAELFLANKYDGIIYRSSLGDGDNVVLFSLDLAECQSRFLYKVSNLDLNYERQA